MLSEAVGKGQLHQDRIIHVLTHLQNAAGPFALAELGCSRFSFKTAHEAHSSSVTQWGSQAGKTPSPC